ncbi:hypothetical protein O181_102669 [Austropuccinia psidii MF-1]|uniref:Uncharacterized protein n=1 Tax=Austropuccinia psidii MF-1 TaxID=1389203 RepID=A0A9Q3PIG4_9BASI|nr:hypothetical protein [Austropuccinia psidii MF-1]
MLSIKLFSAFLILANCCHALLEGDVLKCTSCSSSNINPKAGNMIKCGQVGSCTGECGHDSQPCNNEISLTNWKCNDCSAEGKTTHFFQLGSLGCGANHDFKCARCEGNPVAGSA